MTTTPENNAFLCDTHGACRVPDLPAADTPSPTPTAATAPELVYVGDPMCSWCWGMEPTIATLPPWCSAQGMRFSIVVGGLRPGGGAEWDGNFRAFLRHHWEEIGRRTGQPFGWDLLERPYFNYDTEPACRAVVVARTLLAGCDDNHRTLYRFFAAIQRHFYVHGQDPADPGFYHQACAQAHIHHGEFLARFDTPQARQATLEEFHVSRLWGIHGFPSFVLRADGQVRLIASGYLERNELLQRVGQALAGADR